MTSRHVCDVHILFFVSYHARRRRCIGGSCVGVDASASSIDLAKLSFGYTTNFQYMQPQTVTDDGI